MRHMQSVLWVLCAARYVIGNTEIVNFVVQDSPAISLPFTHHWPHLSQGVPTLTINTTSAPRGAVLPQDVCHELSHWSTVNPEYCPHELWLVLDLDAVNWRGFRKFTLRLSWPAFHPTDISMKIFEPDDLLPTREGQPKRSNTRTRRKYARIQVIHSGVMTPTSVHMKDSLRYQLPVVVTLEPLHLGVLPGSVIPVLISIFFVLLLGIPLATNFDCYLRSVAQKVWEDEKFVSKRS